MTLESILNEKPGTAFMMSNEAMVRAALESGVVVAPFYPGSPTTEIMDAMVKHGPSMGVRTEVSVNEKVALETAAGASMAGHRSFTSMKSVGVNVASDALFSLGYTGIKGGLVLVMADDPYAHSSQTEQDGRLYAPASYIPMLEPTSPQEAYDMVKQAYEISEKNGVPIIIRTTTRVNHQSGLVKFGKLEKRNAERISWRSLGRTFVTLGSIAREDKARLLERTAKLSSDPVLSELCHVRGGDGATGIIGSGIGRKYALEAMENLGVRMPMLEIGATWPFPEDVVREFLSGLEKVLVVEELSPYMENMILAICKKHGLDTEVYGKTSGHFLEMLEYNVGILEEAIGSLVGKQIMFDRKKHMGDANSLKKAIPSRAPTFCAGCPHRATLYGLQKAMKKVPAVLEVDIGCYSMMPLPPYNLADSLLCMGCSLGVGAGKETAVKERVVAIMGDSTFFHAGMPGLANIIHNDHDILLVLLDNRVTAMTGQQSHPGSEFTQGNVEHPRKIDLEGVVRGMGLEPVFIDAFSPMEEYPVLQENMEKKGPRVLISRGPCALYNDRLKRRDKKPIVPYGVNKETCHKCHTCMRMFYCPAISIDEDNASRIDPTLCNGCGVCSTICPFDIIHRAEGCPGNCRAPSHTEEVGQ